MDRFWSKAKVATASTSPHVDTPCWVWAACRQESGYGLFRLDGRMQGAHRASWVLTNGPIPDGMGVRHKCDNPPCVNPEHLWLGTDAEDTADKMSKGRQYKGEKHHSSKLTEAEAREIISRGMSPAEAWNAYPHARRSAYDVAKGTTWKHLKGEG